MAHIQRGKAWVSEKYVYAFDIIIQKFWTSAIDPAENAKWVMAGVDEQFNAENAFKNEGYTFIVAGHNFAGGGKSIEHVVTGMMGAGIQAVFADSFSRLQFRNATNYGLPFITCKDIVKHVKTGDELEFNPDTGIIKNLTTGFEAQALPVAPFVAEIASSGGLMEFIKRKIADGTAKDLR
ncbi:MAG: 3-isopropylmalate dehydratase [Candidatus Kapabacteria bacterium]|jgi:3-isopropylmalate/(R)-2-methylmalate dehydratase small subunit|nr:3-isopropylmalate dehydratase [Candidatus Kapabacteria bacterium]